MKTTIIQFSPSGNTLKVSEMLKEELERRNQEVQLIDITGERKFFLEKDIHSFLREKVKQHDVLLIGGPVYAHHLQYHVQDILKALPKPDDKWGKYAVPYVTYGGISSGIALREAGKLLKKSGRIVHAGMKVSAPHRMTRAFMPDEFNKDKLQGDFFPQVTELVNRIMQLDHTHISKCNSKSLKYNGLITVLKANIIFKEKVWHEKRYPNIQINHEKCTNCGKCVKNCPVLHLSTKDNKPYKDVISSCIHCLVCASECPNQAVELIGNLEKGKAHMNNNIARNGNKETPVTAVYPEMKNKLLSGKSRIGNYFFMKMVSGLESKVRYKKHSPEIALKSAGIKNAKNILEVGCGSGYYSLPASKLIKAGSQYLAIDIHPKAVEATTKKLEKEQIKNIKVEKRNALNTMLPDSSFDSILLFGVIPSPFLPIEKLLGEMCRISKKGACLSVWTLGMPWSPGSITRNGIFEYAGENNGVHNFIKTF